MQKVMVINGSPRIEKGNTALILNPFIEGMKEAGASVDLVYTKKMKIRGCMGEFQCWYEKIGVCMHNDDMNDLYPKLRETDILVLATPIYIPLPGEMQNLINRLCPLVEPVLEFRNGRTRARLHKNVRISKFVLVGTGGWWEIGNFDTLLRIVEELALNTNTEFTGAVIRPHSSLMRYENENTDRVNKALREAGRQLVKEGRFSRATLDAISEPLISEEEYRRILNKDYEDARGNQK
ncbi:MAG: flavodoxin family protein [Candidatus Thorarchaeota archaeon]